MSIKVVIYKSRVQFFDQIRYSNTYFFEFSLISNRSNRVDKVNKATATGCYFYAQLFRFILLVELAYPLSTLLKDLALGDESVSE